MPWNLKEKSKLSFHFIYIILLINLINFDIIKQNCDQMKTF